MDIKKKVKQLPQSCGVYIMKSKRNEVLYVGKASSLKTRVSSYFSKRISGKTDILIAQVADIDYIECESEEQALILEAALIKEKKPKYNISLKDSKSYPYVEITTESFPRIFISRPKKRAGKVLFGPYPKAGTLKSALVLIRKAFPYRTCRTMPKSACLFYHLKLCPAPCIGKISLTDYKTVVDGISKILKGERKRLVRSIDKKMQKLAAKKQFERAARLRDKLLAIESLYKGKPKAHEIISLKDILNLPSLPLVIEAIDISSLGKSDSVGSLVTFRDGAPDKNNYRRFLIRGVTKLDDYAKIAEVVKRRYSRLIKEKHKLPDLIIIDGGKGHVMTAYRVIKSLGVEIPLIGIAKRNEEVWFADKKKPLIIAKEAPCLHLIQRFEKKVLRVVAEIPVGEVRSYKWVAKEAGRPKAYRAVANTLKKNPYPLFIPCHRVIQSSKKLGGYSLGTQLKKELINLEKKIKDMIK